MTDKEKLDRAQWLYDHQDEPEEETDFADDDFDFDYDVYGEDY